VIKDALLVVVAKNADEVDSFNPAPDSRVEIKYFVNVCNLPVAAIGNQHLSGCTREVFGMCHVDCSFGEGALWAFVEAAGQGQVCGISGKSMDWTVRWSHSNPGPVSTLDCCAVFFRANSELRFDASTFDGFHCYVEDVCLQAQARGIPVIVPEANAGHRGERTGQKEWQADYERYRGKLSSKWEGVTFRTT
jgi:Glycosyltransferase like family